MSRQLLGVGAVIATFVGVVILVKRAQAEPGEAEFTVTNLYIHPEVAEVGAPVYIEATVTNIGDASGSYIVVLSGNLSGEQVITLSPGATKVVPFEVRPDVIGIYTVQVDGLAGSFEVIAPLPPVEKAITIGYMGTRLIQQVSPDTWFMGILVRATNHHPEESGAWELDYASHYPDGSNHQEGTITVDLAAGQVKDFEFGRLNFASEKGQRINVEFQARPVEEAIIVATASGYYVF